MQDYIKPSLEYIEQNLKTDIKIEELANMAGYSVTHYRRVFNQITGLSVAKYISRKRINHALFEILAGRKAIDAVLEYGFDNYSVFYRAFVKMYGCSPMKYLTLYKDLTPKEMEDILMDYNITERQKEKLTERWGNGLYEKILENFDLYTEKWKLVDFEFSDFLWHHVVFYCKSEFYGDCVLKMYDHDELEREYNALLEFNGSGKRYVKALGYEHGDRSWGAMLIKRIFPGEKLSDEPSLEKRLEVYSELFRELHIVPENPDVYGSYTHGVNCIGMPDEILFGDREPEDSDEIKLKEAYPELYPHRLKAQEIYFKLASVYDKKLLIHGNLHSGNILSCGEGKYKVIEPVGIVGDPVFDIGGIIFSECCWFGKKIAEPEKAEIIINYLEKSLNIPDKILRQIFYLTTVMSRVWNIDRVKFAESVLTKRK
jgi:AraC-like DNA-binding protein